MKNQNNITMFTQALISTFLGMTFSKKIAFLKAMPKSILVLQKIEQNERKKILNAFKPKDLMVYLAKQSKDCENHRRDEKIDKFIGLELRRIFQEANTSYMNEILEYLVNTMSPTWIVALLPEKYIITIARQAIAKLPRYTWKRVDDVCESDNYEDPNDQMDAIQELQTSIGNWLIQLILKFDQSMKFVLLHAVTHTEMKRMFQTLWLHTYHIIGSNNDLEEMPAYIILCGSSIESLEGHQMNDFLTKTLPKWPNGKLLDFFNYVETRNGFGYDGHHWYIKNMIDGVMQGLPLTRVVELLKKDESLLSHLSNEQRFDLNNTSSNAVLDLKYSIVDLKRSPDITNLSEKESFELLVSILN